MFLIEYEYLYIMCLFMFYNGFRCIFVCVCVCGRANILNKFESFYVFVVSVNLFLVLSLERATWKISVC